MAESAEPLGDDRTPHRYRIVLIDATQMASMHVPAKIERGATEYASAAEAVDALRTRIETWVPSTKLPLGDVATNYWDFCSKWWGVKDSGPAELHRAAFESAAQAWLSNTVTSPKVFFSGCKPGRWMALIYDASVTSELESYLWSQI